MFPDCGKRFPKRPSVSMRRLPKISHGANNSDVGHGEDHAEGDGG
jgi:hypothetical protein